MVVWPDRLISEPAPLELMVTRPHNLTFRLPLNVMR